MPYNALQLGSTTSSSEAIQTSLKKISEMLAELYSSDPELFDWNNFDKSIIPNIDSIRDLGSPTRQWRSLYVSNDTIFIGGTSLSVTEDGSIQVGGNTFNPVVSYNDLTDRPVLFSGSYADLTNRPVLFSGSYADLTDKPVLFSGSYADLTDKPVLFSGSYNDLTNRPVLFSGSYDDLTNRPTIPSLTGYATESFVGTAISNLVDTAPATLNTLNELAAALGDDPNFATTITTALGNKADTASLNISDWDTAYGWGDHSIAGYLTSSLAASTYLTISNASSTYLTSSTAASTYQPLDGDLTAIAGLSGTNGLLRKTGTNTWSIDTTAFLTSSSTINSLSDVDTATVAPTVGQVLKWNGTNWVPGSDIEGGAGGAVDLDGLTDVVITSPSVGQVLKWNGSQWINDTDQTASAGSGIVASGSVTDNRIVRWDGTSTVQVQNSLVTISDTGIITAPAVGNIIPFNFVAQANFPSSNVYRGALAYSQTDARVYFANGASGWVALATSEDVANPNVSLDGLNDVTITSPVANQILQYDGTKWANAGVSGFSDTTYSISAETTTGGANLRLLSSGAVTDDVKIASGTGITVARSDANTITISATSNAANSFGIVDVLFSDGVTSQGTVTADAANDTLKFIGSEDIVITPIPVNNTITFELANTIPTDINQLDDVDGLLTGGATPVLPSRSTASASTASLANNATGNISITGFKSYALYKIQTSAAAWVRLYTTTAARTSDAARTQGQDPAVGSGVIAEVITTGAQTILTSPGVFGFNDETVPTTSIAIAVTNLSGAATAITVTLTLLQLEA
jgi:hypothetical protein